MGYIKHRRGPRQMPLATRPHGQRGKRDFDSTKEQIDELMSFKAFRQNVFNKEANEFFSRGVGSQKDVFHALSLLGAMHVTVRFSHFRRGVATFTNDDLGGGHLMLEIDFGTTEPEEIAELEFDPVVRLLPSVVARASRIRLWEPGHSENAPIIDYINRAF